MTNKPTRSEPFERLVPGIKEGKTADELRNLRSSASYGLETGNFAKLQPFKVEPNSAMAPENIYRKLNRMDTHLKLSGLKAASEKTNDQPETMPQEAPKRPSSPRKRNRESLYVFKPKLEPAKVVYEKVAAKTFDDFLSEHPFKDNYKQGWSRLLVFPAIWAHFGIYRLMHKFGWAGAKESPKPAPAPNTKPPAATIQQPKTTPAQGQQAQAAAARQTAPTQPVRQQPATPAQGQQAVPVQPKPALQLRVKGLTTSPDTPKPSVDLFNNSNLNGKNLLDPDFINSGFEVDGHSVNITNDPGSFLEVDGVQYQAEFIEVASSTYTITSSLTASFASKFPQNMRMLAGQSTRAKYQSVACENGNIVMTKKPGAVLWGIPPVEKQTISQSELKILVNELAAKGGKGKPPFEVIVPYMKTENAKTETGTLKIKFAPL